MGVDPGSTDLDGFSSDDCLGVLCRPKASKVNPSLGVYGRPCGYVNVPLRRSHLPSAEGRTSMVLTRSKRQADRRLRSGVVAELKIL